MPNNDLRSEWAFYGAKLDTIGHLYLRSTKLPAESPDVLFFLLYTCRLLTDKKLTITTANYIKDNLEHTRERWYEILNWEEKRVFTLPCRVIPYRGYAKSCISSSIFFRAKPIFRCGRMGFGFFSNSKHFGFCAGGSVFGLIETLYKIFSSEPKADSSDNRRLVSSEQEKELDRLFAACAFIRRVELGRELNRGNCEAVAYAIYHAVTGDAYPPLTEAQKTATEPMVKRIEAELTKAAERRAQESAEKDGGQDMSAREDEIDV